jgi:hypothetical protein
LGASGEASIGCDSTETPEEIPCQQVPRDADTFTKNPDFIKVGFHIGRFFTVGVDTKKEHAVTEALMFNLEFALEQIKVSIFFPFDVTVVLSILTPLLLQHLIEHSQSKDQYIRVALKRLTET